MSSQNNRRDESPILGGILERIEDLIKEFERRHKGESCGCFDHEKYCIATLGLRCLKDDLEK